MYQLGAVSLGRKSKMDLVPVWWGGEGKKVSPGANEAAQALLLPLTGMLVNCEETRGCSITFLSK